MISTNRLGISALKFLHRNPLIHSGLKYLVPKTILNPPKCGVLPTTLQLQTRSMCFRPDLATKSKSISLQLYSLRQSRQFSTSLANMKYYKPPHRRIQFSNTSRFFSFIPDWLKFLSVFLVISYFVLFVLFPFIFLIVPPLVIFLYGMIRFRKFRYEKQMKRIWSLLTESTLVFTPKRNAQFERARRALNINEVLFPTLEETEEEIARFSLNRIYEAVLENEKGISDFLKTRMKTNKSGEFNVNQLALGSIEDQDYDWQRVRVPDKPTGMLMDAEELMSIRTRPLFDKYSKNKVAFVRISVKLQNRDGDFLNNDILHAYLDKSFGVFKNSVVIEVIPIPGSILDVITNKFNKPFILDEPSQVYDESGDDDTILDVKGTTKNRDI